MVTLTQGPQIQSNLSVTYKLPTHKVSFPQNQRKEKLSIGRRCFISSKQWSLANSKEISSFLSIAIDREPHPLFRSMISQTTYSSCKILKTTGSKVIWCEENTSDYHMYIYCFRIYMYYSVWNRIIQWNIKFISFQSIKNKVSLGVT